MKTLVVGASGATGKHLVQQLLNMNGQVKVIVRSTANIPNSWKNNVNVEIIEATILDFSVDEMAKHVQDCDAVASCLGHNLSRKGIWGKPKKLVSEAVKLLCSAIKKNQPKNSVKCVLMNTAGNRNKDLDETQSIADKVILSLIRKLLPPQVDNEEAAEYLRTVIGQADPTIEWVAVRPDSLIDIKQVTEYQLYPSPIRNVIFNSGKTSRINVGHFMADLIHNDELWRRWKGQMPVIYNKV